MAKSKIDGLCLLREVLVALNIGTFATIVLGLLRAAQIFPEVADVLLRPGAYVSRAAPEKSILSALLLVLGDGILYGSIPFLIMHARTGHSRPLSIKQQSERRRAPRMPLTTPVFVYGRLAGEPFCESTKTLNVSKVGALVLLSEKVMPSQKLIVTLSQTDKDVTCRVARLLEGSEGKILTGVEFLTESEARWNEVAPSKPSIRPESVLQSQD